MVDSNWLKAVVQMPPSIFATTGTNVSVIFIDKSKTDNTSILVDASKLGTKVKDGKNQKTLLSADDENLIINTINNKDIIEDFSIIIDTEKIKSKSYSFGAGQYFETRIEYSDLSPDEFNDKMEQHKSNLVDFFKSNNLLEKAIIKNFESIIYE